MFSTPEFWVLVSFLMFLGLLVYLKVPGMVTAALDERAQRIARELAEAQQLREDAQALLARYEQKRKEAENEAQAIVAQAREDALAYAADTRRKLAESIERRARMAEDKITRAEAQALKDVRAAATDLAVSAAETVLKEQSKGEKGAQMIDNSIEALKSRLN